MRALLTLALGLFIVLCCYWLREPAMEARFIADMKVHVWTPEKPQGAPVILLSHGFSGCADQVAWLAEALAKAGYAIFAPDHKDAVCGNGASRWHLERPLSFDTPEIWDESGYDYRRDDVQALLATLPQMPEYASLDWSHLGLAGHSLGGYAALAMGGALPQWKDARVKAVLALSPSTRPMLAQHGFERLAVPVMYQGGTDDPQVTPYIVERGGAYDLTPAPKYFVSFHGADHLSFTNLHPGFQHISAQYAVAFFNHTLKGKSFPDGLSVRTGTVELFRSQSQPEHVP